MAIEFLVSTTILTREKREERDNVRIEILIHEKADYYVIEGGKFKQYKVNPFPDKDMSQIPEGSKSVIITTEIHRHNVAYCKKFI